MRPWGVVPATPARRTGRSANCRAFEIRDVWSAIADIGGVHRFHPLVRESPINPEAPQTGLGAERTCHFHDGNHIRERVVGFEDGRRLSIEIVEGSMPLASAQAQLEVEPGPDGTSTVRMTMEYTPKFGVFGRAMDALMMNRKFQGVISSVLAGLDEHLSTGEIIGPKWRPATAA